MATPAQDASNEAQIKVRFVTARAEDAVTDAPIAVPLRLRRYGLSEIVNHLLESEPARPFHFLIDGRFLLGSLQDYIDEHSLSSEQVITLEYVEALPPPEQVASHTHDDWVSCVKHLGTTCVLRSPDPARTDASLFFSVVTGAYDGRLRLWTSEFEPLTFTAAHTKPIKCVAPVVSTTSQMVLTGSQDQTVRLFQARENEEGKPAFVATARFVGHTSSVDAVAVNNVTPLRFVSGSWDGQLKIWDLQTSVTDAEGHASAGATVGKRRKVAARQDDDVALRHSLTNMNGHTAAITGIEWTTPETLFSSSMDHVIRQWDMNTGINVHSMTGDTAIQAMSYSEAGSLIITGHADKAVRIWDPRVREGAVIKQKLVSHKNFVSCVAWAPASGTSLQFVSGSYDRTIKVWDVRALQPIHTVTPHKDKVLCVEWTDDGNILSGGADGKLIVTRPSKVQSA